MPAEVVHHREVAHIGLGVVVRNHQAVDNLVEEAGHMEVGQEEHCNLAVEGDIGCMEVEENVLAAAGRHIHHTEVVDMPS